MRRDNISLKFVELKIRRNNEMKTHKKHTQTHNIEIIIRLHTKICAMNAMQEMDKCVQAIWFLIY